MFYDSVIQKYGDKMKKRLRAADIFGTSILFAIIAAAFVLSYFLTKLCLFGREYFTPHTFIDDLVPLWTPSVVVYVLAYVQWIFCLVAIVFQDREHKYRSVSAIMYAILISAVIFIVLPTNTVRPEITGNSIFDRLLKLIYLSDTPVNVLPSFHCMASWIVSRCLAADSKTPRWVNALNFTFTLLVFASVLLTKQHLFLDIPAAILVAEIALLISKRFVYTRLLDRILNYKIGNNCSGGKETK